MNPRRLLHALTILALICLAVTPAAAQEAVLGRWLGPRLGDLKPLASYRGAYSPSRPLGSQSGDLSYQLHRLDFLTPLSQSDRHELALYGHAGLWALDTHARLPYGGAELPDSWWDLKLGASFRREYKPGWIWGGELTLGSPSDQPFGGMDQTSVSATAFLRLPSSGDNAWLVMANYSNTRDFLGGAPIPGLAYAYNPGPKFNAIIGAPLVMLKYRPIKPLTLTGFYFYPRNINARASYDLARDWQVFTAFEWKHQRYFRADRPHDEDRWFFYQKQALAGVTWRPYPDWSLVACAGWAFDRLMFEGENYGDRHQNRIDLDDGMVYGLEAVLRF